jgi:geranylgeranyl reductase family protein
MSAEVVVVGGGPAGAAAAWRVASLGHPVTVVDRAVFPRDKPCGDGVTPRAVKLLGDMGLGTELERFHRVDGFRLVTRFGVREQRWAHAKVGLPDHAYVARRGDLDATVLGAARRAGARVIQGRAVDLVRDAGRVRGVVVERDGRREELAAGVVIAADGATSRLARAARLDAAPTAVVGYAARAELRCDRPDDRFLEVYPELLANDELVPAYGWVFPLGDGVVNVGVGFVSTSRSWRSIRVPVLVRQLVDQLPRHWHLGDGDAVLADPSFAGWKLPMGIAVTPLWRPGFMVCGDAAGVAKPFTGAGISKALQSGMLAGEAADRALRTGRLSELASYEREVRALWGRSHRAGARFARMIGSPTVMRAFVRGLGTPAGARAAHVLFSQAIGRDRTPADLRA